MLTDAISEARVFATENEAVMAGEDFCHMVGCFRTANVDAARADGGWIAVVTQSGEDFDRYVA